MGGIYSTFLMLAAGGTAAPVLGVPHDVVLSRRVIHLGDVADLSTLVPILKERAARIEVARVPDGQSDIMLSGMHILSRARAQMAILGSQRKLAVPLRLAVHYRPAEKSRPMAGREIRCLAAVHDITADAILLNADFTKADCPASLPRQAFRFDAARRAAVANQPMIAGTIISRYRDHGANAISAGQELSLVSVVGPVTVSRQVVALQSASDGSHLFVRTQDGEVFSSQFRSNR